MFLKYFYFTIVKIGDFFLARIRIFFADPDPKHWNNVPKKLVVLTYPQIMVSHSLGNYRPDSFYQTGASCRL